MGGGPSTKWKHEDCVVAPRQTAGTESPATLDACFMQMPASESLFFPFPSQKGQINRPDLEKRSSVHACNQVGVVCTISVFSGEATLLHGSGVIACACSELSGLKMQKSRSILT